MQDRDGTQLGWRPQEAAGAEDQQTTAQKGAVEKKKEKRRCVTVLCAQELSSAFIQSAWVVQR